MFCAKREWRVLLPQWDSLDPCHSLLKDKEILVVSIPIVWLRGLISTPAKHPSTPTHSYITGNRTIIHRVFISNCAHSMDPHLTREPPSHSGGCQLANTLACSRHTVGLSASQHIDLQCQSSRMLEWKQILRMSLLGCTETCEFKGNGHSETQQSAEL